MRYHTSPLVMLGIGVRASCHSRACTILVYCASMESTVTYAKRRCIVSVLGSPGLLPSCLGSCVAAPLLQWRTPRCWRLSPLCMSVLCRLQASVSSSPSFAFPICLNSPSAFSLWCAFLSRCSLTLSCLYARFISSVVAQGTALLAPGTSSLAVCLVCPRLGPILWCAGPLVGWPPLAGACVGAVAGGPYLLLASPLGRHSLFLREFPVLVCVVAPLLRAPAL